MITIFSGTNRKNSNTAIVAEHIYKLCQQNSNETVELFKLEDLPDNFIHKGMYDAQHQSSEIAAIQDQFLIPANKLLFVVPEYNGGIPGVLKLFLDACSIRAYNESFKGGKKAALVGVSSGRSGCLRGMEYMTGFLNYLTIQVLPNKLPISSIESLIEDGLITDSDTLKAVKNQVAQFIQF